MSAALLGRLYMGSTLAAGLASGSYRVYARYGADPLHYKAGRIVAHAVAMPVVVPLVGTILFLAAVDDVLS